MPVSDPDSPLLTDRFDQALAYASRLHRTQCRKGTAIPYVSHLLAVAAIALENGADEDQAIAALLHDAVEDQGGLAQLEAIRARFGHDVAAMVADCTDAVEEPKPEWRPRKEAYIASLATKASALSNPWCGNASTGARLARCGITAPWPMPSRTCCQVRRRRGSRARWTRWKNWLSGTEEADLTRAASCWASKPLPR